MKKTFLLALLCCLFSLGFAGNVVPVDDARTASVNFIKAVYPDMNVTASDFVLKHTELDENGDAIFYQFAIREQGFILVSANDAVDPILAYSVTNNFNRNIPNYAVSAYREEIKAAKNTVNPVALKAWNKLVSTRATREIIGQYISEEVGPFVTSKWNQGEYFNYLCPAQENATQYQQNINCDNHVPAGCVATAMSQLMYYYRYPEYGTGGVGYTPIHYEYDANNNPIDTFQYPMQAQRFDNLHEYDAMPSNVDFYAGEVAKLMWHSGISVRMGYGPSSSGAQSADALTALKNYWGYNRTAQMYNRSEFSNSTKWTDTLTTELRKLHPIYYSGADADGGHAFILDGFQVVNDVNRTAHYGDTILHIDTISSDTTYIYEYFDSVQHLTYDSVMVIDSVSSHYIDTVLVYDTTYHYNYFDSTYYYTYDSTVVDSSIIYNTTSYTTHTDSLTTYTMDTIYSHTSVHVNWGWGGYNDGYFKIAGAGHMGGYTQNEAAMIGVYPANQAPKDTTGHKRMIGSRGSISDGAGNINYRPNTDRTWTIYANGATRYTFKFLRLATEANNDVIIFYKNGDMTNEEKRVSGTTLPSTFSISADSVTVRFLTNADSITDKGFVFDFVATVAAPYCNEDYVALTDEMGVISDKSGSDNVDPSEPYRPDGICRWEINGANTTYFSYPKIDLGHGDYVDIYEYKGLQRYELLKRIDIYNWPTEDVFVSHSRRIRIHFVTDNYDEKTGFELTYQIVTDVKENGITDLNIFPNPASSTLNVLLNTEEAGQLTFRISDMTGRTISTESVENYGGEMMHTLNVSNLSKGLYLLSIEGKQVKTVHKFIVE